MLRGGEGRHIAEGAVVVGNEEPFVGNHTAAAVKAQRNHGIGQPAGFFIVDFPDAQLKAARLHILFQRTVQALNEPHSFIGPGGRKRTQAQQEGQKPFFHSVNHGLKTAAERNHCHIAPSSVQINGRGKKAYKTVRNAHVGYPRALDGETDAEA